VAAVTPVPAAPAAQLAPATQPASSPWLPRAALALTLLLILCGGYLVGRFSVPAVDNADMASPIIALVDAGVVTPSPSPSSLSPPTGLASEVAPHSPLLVEVLATPPAELKRYQPYLPSCNGYGDLELLTSERLLLVLCGGHADDEARTSSVCLENHCVTLGALKSKKALPRLCTRMGMVAEPVLRGGKLGYRIQPAGTGCHRAPYLLPLTAKGAP
jgi:hypothetical protein